jgi:hypothetical protein
MAKLYLHSIFPTQPRVGPIMTLPGQASLIFRCRFPGPIEKRIVRERLRFLGAGRDILGRKVYGEDLGSDEDLLGK